MKNPSRQTETDQESKSDASVVAEEGSEFPKPFSGYSGEETEFLLERFFHSWESRERVGLILQNKMDYMQLLFWFERFFDDAYLEYRKMHE